MSEKFELEGDARSIMEGMPRSALQALYHVVTGKTENLRKSLSGNVIIRFNDIENLYRMLIEQISHYKTIADPTVTVVIGHHDERKITYSSWERFASLQAGSASITSDVALKIEFVAIIPSSGTPQRCVINVSLDSSLPIISDLHETDRAPSPFLFYVADAWQTVEIMIEFVDFLMAKNCTSHIEDWFATLEKIRQPKMASFLIKNRMDLSSAIRQLGPIGAGFFAVTYLLTTNSGAHTAEKVIMAVALGLFAWGIVGFIRSKLNSTIMKRLFLSILPTVILITEGDERSFRDVQAKCTTLSGTIVRLIGGASAAILTNVGSSYIYTWIS